MDHFWDVSTPASSDSSFSFLVHRDTSTPAPWDLIPSSPPNCDLSTTAMSDIFPSSPLGRINKKSNFSSQKEATFGCHDQDNRMNSTISPQELIARCDTPSTHVSRSFLRCNEGEEADLRRGSRPQLIVNKAGHAFVSPKTYKVTNDSEKNHSTQYKKRKRKYTGSYAEDEIEAMLERVCHSK